MPGQYPEHSIAQDRDQFARMITLLSDQAHRVNANANEMWKMIEASEKAINQTRSRKAFQVLREGYLRQERSLYELVRNASSLLEHGRIPDPLVEIELQLWLSELETAIARAQSYLQWS